MTTRLQDDGAGLKIEPGEAIRREIGIISSIFQTTVWRGYVNPR